MNATESTPESTASDLSERTDHQLAEAGELDALLARAQTHGLWIQVLPSLWHNIARALRNFPGDTPDMVDWAFRKMLEFNLQFLVRCQLVIDDALRNRILSGADFEHELPADITTEWLPRLQRIEERIIRLSDAYGRVRRGLHAGRQIGRKPVLRVSSPEPDCEALHA